MQRMKGATMNQTEIHVIEQVTNNFYEALNLLFMGNAEPMKNAWSHAEDISYMGPDGLYLIGWEKIESLWSSVANRKLGGMVKPKNVHRVIGSDLAFITCIESGANEIDGESEAVGIRSSTVFRKEQGHWKVIAHQTDLLQFM